MITLPELLSTHSSSLQSTTFSTPQGWNSVGDTTLLSSTTRTLDFSSHSAENYQKQKAVIPIRVEIETLGSRETELDRDASEVDIQAVNTTIRTLRDEILTAAGVAITESSIRSKEKRIIAYRTMDSLEDFDGFALNAHLLAGAFEEVDSGTYARLKIFETFALQKDEEEARMASLILDARAKDNSSRGRH
jgi:hypothetical protein